MGRSARSGPRTRSVDAVAGPSGVGPLGRLGGGHWRHLCDVRLRTQPTRSIEHVLVGPSGIHVIGYAAPGAVDPARAASVAAACLPCAAAAGSVGALLPRRYGDVVRPVVCLRSDDPVAERVDEVLVTSYRAIEHIVRESPRVLSTSEVGELAFRLGVLLEPNPSPTPMPDASRTPRRRALAWAVGAAVTAAAAVGAVLVGPDLAQVRVW